MFWKRYFFKFEQWNAVNEQRKALLQHLDVNPTMEESLGWDDDETSNHDESIQHSEHHDLPLESHPESKLSDSFIVIEKEQGDWDDWE